MDGCGQWMVDLLDYLVLKYPTPIVCLIFGSVIPTFCSFFVVFLLFFLYTCKVAICINIIFKM